MPPVSTASKGSKKSAKGAKPVKVVDADKAPRITLEDGTSGPIVVKAATKTPKELRAESKRGRLLSMARSAKGVKQDACCNEMGWEPRDFADAIRLLTKVNGVTMERNEKGVWHAK